MSSLSNCLKMAILLKSRGRMKISDLARELNVTERQISTYRKNLEDANIWIESKSGKYGGLELVSNISITRMISENDLYVLDMVIEELKHSNNIYQDEFKDIVNTIRANLKNLSQDENTMEYFTIQPKTNTNIELIKKFCNDIIFAYVTKQKLEIEYFSLSSGHSKRVIHPYGITNYKGDPYVVAFCEKRNRVVDFKVCRISSIKTLDEKYDVAGDFSWNDYIKNCIGIYKGNNIDVELEIRDDFRFIVKEKIWVDNQKITDYGDYILFNATMRGYYEIKSWIMSMGSSVKVIKPDNLREDILKETQKIIDLYK